MISSMRRDAETEHVDERIAGVALVEGDLAADGRDADAVAVAARCRRPRLRDRAARQAVVERAEAQRIQQRDRPRAHREDVADDPADAGGRALVRLDERRMVVRLDLEHRRQPVADVDGAGVLPRPLQHARPGRGQRPQVHPGALVAAVLRPHHREHAELGQRRAHAPASRRFAAYSSCVRPWRSRTSRINASSARAANAPCATARARATRSIDQPVGAAERQLARALGMRHQARRRFGPALQMPAMFADRAVRIGLRRRFARRH